MGSTKDVMKLFAERDLRQHFSAFDGWTVTPMAGSLAGTYCYRASRGRWSGIEEAFIAVSLNRLPADEVVSAFDQVLNGSSNKTKKFLLAPQAADTSGIPPHIRVILMSAFAYSGKDLIWLTKKKNAQQVIREKAGQAAVA
ncbi:MAG: hypothetical protein GYA23_02725 [Methanomicrobiales archaeon]|nr:hypothetical protein [Methanomicrobiales archaeon]